MKINEILPLLDATLLAPGDDLDADIEMVCGSDMMSDVLAFVKEKAVLLTGLNNLQVIRTANMMDLHCIVFVRGKIPSEEMIHMAETFGISVLHSKKTMFEACGILYQAGLRGGKPLHE